MQRMDALPPLIEEKLPEVRALCEKYYVKRLAVFGSVAKGTFDPEKSDIDFVVEFDPEPDPLVRGRQWWDFWAALRKLFGRDVDLVERKAIINPYFLQVLDLTERPIYESHRAA